MYTLYNTSAAYVAIRRQEVQYSQRCAVDIEGCCGSSNEASFALAAVVSVQMAVQMTVRSRKRSRTVHVLL